MLYFSIIKFKQNSAIQSANDQSTTAYLISNKQTHFDSLV